MTSDFPKLVFGHLNTISTNVWKLEFLQRLKIIGISTPVTQRHDMMMNVFNASRNFAALS